MEIICNKRTDLSIDKLVEFQGNLKDLSTINYEKLEKQIKKNGFADPFKVWFDGTNYNVLDGHQRLRVLKKMKDKGETIPKLPCDLIECKNKKQAKELVLAFTSQFGKITEEGLNEFINTNDLLTDFPELITEIDLPDFDMDKFIESNFEVGGSINIKEREVDENIETKNECPSCGYRW